MEFRHKSVLLEESIDALQIKPDGIYVDGTLGGGGHSYEICTHLSDKGRLIGIDQDEAAIEAATGRLERFKDRVTIVRSNYCNMKRELGRLGITSVDGVILDLGSPPISLTRQAAALLTEKMLRWTCEWISGRHCQRKKL